MRESQRVLIVEACRALIYRYAYLNDERNFEAAADLFTEDAVYRRPSAPEVLIRGREAILASLRSRPAVVATFHLCSDVLVEVDSPRRARARTRLLLLAGARPPDGGTPDPATLKAPLPGTFRDELTLTAGGWKFSQRIGGLWLANLADPQPGNATP